MTPNLTDQPPLIPAPDNPNEWTAWREGLTHWREEAHKKTQYDPKAYAQPEFAWMQSCFAFGKVMLFDREFIDSNKGQFHVETYLDRLDRDFGGLDALILWQAYPRIGVDRRNQFDHYRQVPGGMPGLKQLIDRLHARNVKVGLAYNPWDTGTHREPKNDAQTIAEIVAEAGFDTVFLDTLPQGSHELRTDLDEVRPGVVLESEIALPIEAIATHQASWAQWFDDSPTPGVLRNKWFEQRHMQHMIRRWDFDHLGEMHMAWMNGAGMLVWENIFGSWNGWNDRDKSILRSMLPVQRRYAKHFCEGEWTPLIETSGSGLFASKWTKDGLTLWTAVNREDKPIEGFVQSISSSGEERLFDLMRGEEMDHGHLALGPRAIGGIVSLPSSQVDDSFKTFLDKQKETYAEAIHQTRRIEPMPVHIRFRKATTKTLPLEMTEIKKQERDIVAKLRVRECGEYGYGQFAFPANPGLHEERSINRTTRFGHVSVAQSEVTNAEYQQFLQDSGYHPTGPDNFLAHWLDGKPKPGDEDKPVVYVSLDDARAYAKWARLRLPTEDEFQLAVAKNTPIWNWTESEHEDGHTTFSMLKGGCDWQAKGSDWYFDSGPRPPDFTAKFIHFWPALDRCETIGFRCAADLQI